jgi:hypothetical protein
MKKIIVCMILLLSSCFSGEPLKNKTQYLNGDNYKGHVLGVPVLKNKVKESKVFGRLVNKGVLSGAPVFGAQITLKDENMKLIKKVSTNLKGEFVFLNQLSDGRYSLIISYKNKIKQVSFDLKGYEADLSDIYL